MNIMEVDNQVNKYKDKVNDFRNNYVDNGNIKKTMYLEINLQFLTQLEIENI